MKERILFSKFLEYNFQYFFETIFVLVFEEGSALKVHLLLDLHIGLITSYSTLNITAVIITAAKLALGI